MTSMGLTANPCQGHPQALVLLKLRVTCMSKRKMAKQYKLDSRLAFCAVGMACRCYASCKPHMEAWDIRAEAIFQEQVDVLPHRVAVVHESGTAPSMKCHAHRGVGAGHDVDFVLMLQVATANDVLPVDSITLLYMHN